MIVRMCFQSPDSPKAIRFAPTWNVLPVSFSDYNHSGARSHVPPGVASCGLSPTLPARAHRFQSQAKRLRSMASNSFNHQRILESHASQISITANYTTMSERRKPPAFQSQPNGARRGRDVCSLQSQELFQIPNMASTLSSCFFQ